jgi:hypothetical protein
MKNLLASLLALFFVLPSNAAPPSDESIRTLFSVMKAESMVNGMYAALEPAMHQTMAQATAGKELTQEQRGIMDRFAQRMSELMRNELSWAKMEPVQIRIYRESFEQAEIDGLIEFYRGPIGQSFLSKMPLVTQKVMAEMQIYMQQMMPKIEAAMQEMATEVNLAK